MPWEIQSTVGPTWYATCELDDRFEITLSARGVPSGERIHIKEGLDESQLRICGITVDFDVRVLDPSGMRILGVDTNIFGTKKRPSRRVYVQTIGGAMQFNLQVGMATRQCSSIDAAIYQALKELDAVLVKTEYFQPSTWLQDMPAPA